MYLNFKILDKFLEQYLIEDFLYLCAVKQQDDETQKEYYSLNPNQKLFEQGYIKTLKNGEVRLDKKGTELLNKISKSDEITSDTEQFANWLISVYKGREDGIVKNKAELKRRIQWFQDQTGLYRNHLALLLKCFMGDTYTKESGLSIQEFKEQNPRMVLSNLVDNVFWTPKNNFARHYNLDDSPLWNYYQDNQKYVEEVWRKNNLE